jgi:energy-coupling factor transporter ATP-binding protein EcfA2
VTGRSTERFDHLRRPLIIGSPRAGTRQTTGDTEDTKPGGKGQDTAPRTVPFRLWGFWVLCGAAPGSARHASRSAFYWGQPPALILGPQLDGIEVVRRNLDEVRKRIGFLFNVPEDQLLFPKVIDDAAFGLSRQAVSPAQATAKTMVVLHAFGVGQLAQSSLHHLSHGQKQRVALAGALVCEPPLLLLDEPSAALDPPGRRHLERMLGAQPAAIVVATHDLDFATGLCTRFVVIEEGRIVFDSAEPNEIRQRWQET